MVILRDNDRLSGQVMSLYVFSSTSYSQDPIFV